MQTTRKLAKLTLAVVVIVVVAVPTLAADQCSFDFTFSETTAGDVRVEVVADCSPYAGHQTTLSAYSPGDFGYSSQAGNSAVVILDGASGTQQYCGNASASYWKNGNATFDSGQGSECASF